MKIAMHHWDVPTRPCTFSLCLQDGCVFADFNETADGLVTLTRVSFDGYGCCTAETPTMSAEDSRTLLDAVACGNVCDDAVRAILFRYFDANKSRLWADALADHSLLPAHGTA